MSQDSQGTRRPERPRLSQEDEIKMYASQQVEPNKALPGTLSWKRQKGAFQDLPADFKPSELRRRRALGLYVPLIVLGLVVLAFIGWEVLFSRGPQP